jgi:acetyltransferase-like isoleucine patch superfamily enzyme
MIVRIPAYVFQFTRRAIRRFFMLLVRPAFARSGVGVNFSPFDFFTYRNIELGSDVSISVGAHFSASESRIVIGSKVMFGPNVTIMCGDHNTSAIGRYMVDVEEKLPCNDLPVVIEDDVWVGTGVIILKGVTIGRGAIIAAGSVVSRDVPPYAIVAGVPARVVRKRWSDDEITRHESLLGIPPGDRSPPADEAKRA